MKLGPVRLADWGIRVILADVNNLLLHSLYPVAALLLVGCGSEDPYTLDGPRHYVSGYAARHSDGRINVVIEIPSGTCEKWEVAKDSGDLVWELVDGQPRVIKYLSYPGNYGMVPQTLLPTEAGGDGDPLDVLVLGPAVARGSVVKARVIGVLELLDGGEQDDKLLAVLEDSPLDRVASLEQLDEEFPGVTQIVRLWFSNYKGPGRMESKGFGSVTRAEEILVTAIEAYTTRN